MTMPTDMLAYNRQIVKEFRANAGVLGGSFAGGSMLLLSTIGRNSGEERTSPMMFKDHGDRILVIASNNGSTAHPAWYINLVSHPSVIVERGAERFAATARTATGEERAAPWADLIASHPFFVQHQVTAGAREIPLVVLERRP